jgi:transcription initiation factor TFIIIB Brf1 subunit/transcription initiation factor TFIIB
MMENDDIWKELDAKGREVYAKLKASNCRYLQGKHKKVIVAALKYIQSIRNKDASVSQKSLAKQYCVSEVSIRKRYKEIVKHWL